MLNDYWEDTPMPFQPIINTTMVHVRWTQDGQQCENTYAYIFQTLPGFTTLYNLCVEVWGTIGVKMQRQMCPDVVFREVYARNMDAAIAEQATYTLPPGTVGTRAGAAVPSNSAIQLTTRTGLTGRSHHGGKRYGGISENDVTRNQIENGLRAFLLDLALSILAQRLGGAFVPAVPSRRLGVSNVMRSVVLNNDVVDSQKTRLPQHGN